MKKKRISDLDNETIERIVTMAQEEKKPFEMIKEEFGIGENDVTELIRKRLPKDKFEAWKKKFLPVNQSQNHNGLTTLKMTI